LDSTLKYTQKNRGIAIHTILPDDTLLLQRFSGSEGVSQLFSFDLHLLSERDDLSFDDLIGQPATIRIRLADKSDRYWNGVISHFSQERSGQRLTSYRARLVPWFWLLTQTADCRIFQKKTVPQIVKDIFEEFGFRDSSFELYGEFEKRDYCVQYRETYFNFISRLLEDEGIYYFFEHNKTKHTLVLANYPYAYKSCLHQATAQYGVSTTATRTQDVLLECSVEQQIRPGGWAHADYDFEQPSSHLLATITTHNPLKIYDYPGHFRTRAAGAERARIRFEEQLAS